MVDVLRKATIADLAQQAAARKEERLLPVT
jgi:hypothetical protein